MANHDPGSPAGPLPRRRPSASFDATAYGPPAPDFAAPVFAAPVFATAAAGRSAGPVVRAELATLRHRVPGVRGCVVADVDGRPIGHDLTGGSEPHDLATLAATTFGLGLQCGMALDQGPFRESTLRSRRGYFTVFAVSGDVLLAVLGDDGLDVTRLHLEARPVLERLAHLLAVG